MAYTALSNVSSGQTITSSGYNQLIANTVMACPTFVDEAARDAAITSPEEGMICCITSPSAAQVTATGTVPMIPQAAYYWHNGTVWVHTLHFPAAYSNTSVTTTSTTYSSTVTGDATLLSVTLRTGSRVRVNIAAQCSHSASGGVIYLGWGVSGATTQAAADSTSAYATIAGVNYQAALAGSINFSGLTNGVNTFYLAYKTSTGTATFTRRSISVDALH